MTKQARITTLLALGMSTRTIADEVGCGTSYVRTVRQRLAGVRHDLAWRGRNREKNRATAREWQLANLERCRQHSRNYYHREKRKRLTQLTKASVSELDNAMKALDEFDKSGGTTLEDLKKEFGLQ